MKIVILIALVALAAPVFAQDAAAMEGQGESDVEVARVPLESPFLQDDLELIVGNVQRPNGMVWFQSNLYTVCNGDWTIYRIDDETGETVTFVFGVRNGNTLIAERTGIGFDIYVPDPDTGAIWKVDQSRSAPATFSASVEAPWGIVRLVDGRLLVSDTASNSIYEINAAGETRVAQAELRAPTGLVSDGERVYFANGGSARRGLEYFRLEADGEYSEVRPLVAGLQNTTNLALGADGYLYFSYALGTRGVIGRVDPALCLEEGCTNDEVELVVFSDNPAPLAITLSDDMRLFLHSRFRPEIYWVQLPGAPQDA